MGQLFPKLEPILAFKQADFLYVLGVLLHTNDPAPSAPPAILL